MSVWFTSDLHIGHDAVAQMRMSAVVADAHDCMLADNWDRVVNPEDQIWVLGDLSGGGTEATAHALNWVADRPGVKHLIAGNHDPVHPMHRDSHRWQSAFSQVFASVQPFARRKIGAHRVLLSHFPYTGDRGEDRCSQYRLRNEGMPLLHGHTHSPERTSFAAHTSINDLLTRLALQIHVGVDAWRYYPVHIDTLARFLNHAADPTGDQQ